MKIDSLEIKLLKSSEIKEGDVILVKIKESDKLKLNKDNIRHLYDQISKMINKSIPIYFFPDNLSIDIIKKSVNMTNNTVKNENTNT